MAKELKTFAEAVHSINLLNKKWNILSAGDPSLHVLRLPLYDFPIDLTFMGGLPYGELGTLSGVEHSGKSSVAAAMMARYQKDNPGKICVWVDAEKTLQTQGEYFRTEYGLSYDESCFLRLDTTGLAAEDIFKFLITLQGYEEIGMIVIDSSRALISKADLDNDFDKDNGQRASVAKSMGKFVKMMIQYLPKRNNILLVINQVTITKDLYSTTYEESGGYSLRYFPTYKIRFGTRTFIAQTPSGYDTDISATKAQAQTAAAKEVCGLQFHYAVVKNRLGRMTNAGGYITVRYGFGIDRVYDFLKVADGLGLIAHPSPKTFALANIDGTGLLKDPTSNEDLQFSSYNKLKDYLNENQEFFIAYYTKVLNYLCEKKQSLNLLDTNIMQELIDQEAAIMKDTPTEADALAEECQVDNEE